MNKEKILEYGLYALIAYLIITNINKLMQSLGFSETRDEKKTSNEITSNVLTNAKSQISVAKEKGEVPSFTKQSYIDLANRLYFAMRGGSGIFGDVNNEAVYSVFANLKKDLDMNWLIDAFGKRELDGVSRDLVTYVNLTMPDRTSLDKSIADINELFESKKMKFRF